MFLASYFTWESNIGNLYQLFNEAKNLLTILAHCINVEVFNTLLKKHNELVRRSNDMLLMLNAIYEVNPHYRA